MQTDENKTVDIDTSGPGAEIDVPEEKDESVVETESKETKQGALTNEENNQNDNQSDNSSEKSDEQPTIQTSETKKKDEELEIREKIIEDLVKFWSNQKEVHENQLI